MELHCVKCKFTILGVWACCYNFGFLLQWTWAQPVKMTLTAKTVNRNWKATPVATVSQPVRKSSFYNAKCPFQRLDWSGAFWYCARQACVFHVLFGYFVTHHLTRFTLIPWHSADWNMSFSQPAVSQSPGVLITVLDFSSNKQRQVAFLQQC